MWNVMTLHKKTSPREIPEPKIFLEGKMKKLIENVYLILGMGNIGRILVKRLMEVGIPADRIMIYDTDSGRTNAVVAQFKVKPVDLRNTQIGAADVIVLATPPKPVVEILSSMAGVIHSEQLIISMAAAVPLERMRAVIRQDVPIVRILPNPPSMLGKGMNPVAFETSVSPEVKEFVHSLLDVLGKTVEVRDDQMSWCVGLTGAALRTVLPVLDGMFQAGVEAGLSQADARRVAAQIMMGTAALALETDLPLEQIRTLTPMQTLDEKMVSDLFLDTARNTRQKVETTQAALMGN
jgi:pyrroline-5-carboxylate reductase